jgi:outer membrane protein OmpA-like peptidoglycan-associated protein
MRSTRLWVLYLFLLLPPMLLGQRVSTAGLEDYTLKLRLIPGLVFSCPIYGGHNTTGQLIGDYEHIVTITSVSKEGLSFNWSMTYPANFTGHRLVQANDMQKSRKVSVYYWSGENGPRSGYSDTYRISDAIYADLKAGNKTGFEFDGNENPVSVQKVGEEDLVALVNDRKVKIHTIKGKTANGWYIWVLDNPGFPMMVKGNASWHWTVPSFIYPEASEKNLLSQLKEKGEATTHAILFAFNSAELENESKPILDAVAGYLKANPAVRMEIQGHTDNIGSAQFNLELSRNRAESVKKYLAQQGGIDVRRLSTTGFGFTKPVSDNSTAEGRALNRRVVFKQIQQQR